jgi:hypothetical protein
MNRTPTALITVASAMSTEPSRIPLAAPDAEVIDGSLPTISNPDHPDVTDRRPTVTLGGLT